MTEIEVTKRTIKALKKSYGKKCKEYYPFCSVCQAYLCIAFLKEHLELLEEEND